jgi:hypothetical protein
VSRIEGTFEVQVLPQPQAPEERAVVARSVLAKTYFGPVSGKAAGVMLACNTEVEGSAAYVAIERFAGTVEGRTGSFALQHVGQMNRGAGTLTIRVVPDSGTGELAGITGSLGIRIADGKHHYALDYTLPA